MKGEAVDAKFCAKLPGKTYLYEGELPAKKKGRFSLSVTIDKQTIDVPGCLIAI